MTHAKDIVVASFEAGREFFRPPVHHEAGQPAAAHPAPTLVPIRTLAPRHRTHIAAHLMALAPHDRYLRFGYSASDEQIQRYVDGLHFERDEIYGIFNRKLQLIAMAHLAYASDPRWTSCSEFGVSVLADARGRGYGAALFDRAVMHARNEGVELLFIHALTENTAMLHIATKAGATVVRQGSESEAHLQLPPATLDTRMTELVDARVAEVDYRLKVQAKQFWAFLGQLHCGRHSTPPAT